MPGALPRRRRRRGSVLIVALLIAAIIAVMLGSYLNLNLSSTRLAKRSFGTYAALNLAEAGAEEAVWSFNRVTAGDSTAWNGWSVHGAPAWRRFTGFDFGHNTTGWVKVYVDNHVPGPTSQPRVITQSAVETPGLPSVTRMLEVTLRRRSYFANGLVSRDKVVFNGANASVDSWNSDPDNDPFTPPVDYSAAVRTDRGSVASTAVGGGSVVVNQAHIWGYVATGGGQPNVGANGSIRGASTPPGVRIDLSRVSTDFSANFGLLDAPKDATLLVTVPPILGVPGLATTWRTGGISLSGSDVLTVVGDVTLVLTARAGTNAISLTGNSLLVIAPRSTLTIYTEGDLRIGGRGLANPNVQPISCRLLGTNNTADGQQFDIVGNGALRCVVYAPNGDVRIVGDGDVMGSIVARNITLAGNAAFHYDESLATQTSNEPFTISKWRELTSETEIAPFRSLFEGW